MQKMHYRLVEVIKNMSQVLQRLKLKQHVNRFAMDTLNELEFQCKKCRLIIKYKALADHFDICSKQIHLCSLGCGDKKEMTLEQIKHHLLLACPNAT